MVDSEDAEDAGSSEQVETKPAAHKIRVELAAFGTTGGSTLLQELLVEHGADETVTDLLRLELADRDNLTQANTSNHTPDLVVDLAVELGLDRSWDPTPEDLRGAAERVVEMAIRRAQRAIAALTDPSVARLRRQRIRRVPDGDRGALRLLLASRHQRRVQLDVELVTAELLCRHVVQRATNEIVAIYQSRGTPEAASAADDLSRAADLLIRPHLEISVRPVAEASRGPDLLSRSRAIAKEAGDVDPDLLVAHAALVTHRFGLIAAREGKRRRARSVREALTSDGSDRLLQAEDPRWSNTPSEQYRRPEEIALASAEVDELEGRVSAQRAAPRAEDALHLYLHLLRHVPDPDQWLKVHFPPLSSKTSGVTWVWSAVQATDPHRVVWDGYPGVSVRQSQHVKRVAEEIKLLWQPRQREPEENV